MDACVRYPAFACNGDETVLPMAEEWEGLDRLTEAAAQPRTSSSTPAHPHLEPLCEGARNQGYFRPTLVPGPASHCHPDGVEAIHPQYSASSYHGWVTVTRQRQLPEDASPSPGSRAGSLFLKGEEDQLLRKYQRLLESCSCLEDAISPTRNLPIRPRPRVDGLGPAVSGTSDASSHLRPLSLDYLDGFPVRFGELNVTTLLPPLHHGRDEDMGLGRQATASVAGPAAGESERRGGVVHGRGDLERGAERALWQWSEGTSSDMAYDLGAGVLETAGLLHHHASTQPGGVVIRRRQLPDEALDHCCGHQHGSLEGWRQPPDPPDPCFGHHHGSAEGWLPKPTDDDLVLDKVGLPSSGRKNSRLETLAAEAQALRMDLQAAGLLS